MLVQHLLSLFNLWLAFQLLGELSPELLASASSARKRQRMLTVCWGGVLLLYPAQMIYASLIMTEIVFQSLLLMACFALFRAWKSESIWWSTGYTLCLLVAMLTKPVMYVFAFPHLIGMGVWAWQQKKVSLGLLALLPVMLIGGYSSWNQARTGYYHYSSIQSLSLFNYTTRALLTHTHDADYADAWIDSMIVVMEEQPTYAEQQMLIQEACQDQIMAAPGAYIGLHLKGMVNFFLDPGRFDLYQFFGWEPPEQGLLAGFTAKGYAGIWGFFRAQPMGIILLLTAILLVNLFKVLALIMFTFSWRIPLSHRIILLLFIGYVAFLTGISGASRFAVPVFPLVLVIVGYVCTHIRWPSLGKGN